MGVMCVWGLGRWCPFLLAVWLFMSPPPRIWPEIQAHGLSVLASISPSPHTWPRAPGGCRLFSPVRSYVSLSFPTISSSGPNGAIIHYHPHPETCRDITTDEVYLCDSGGQYLDGTTDVTRTVHFGTPTDHERKLFTYAARPRSAVDCLHRKRFDLVRGAAVSIAAVAACMHARSCCCSAVLLQ